tara:strand:+ start:349 stop:891 length:543 start_codon:yes stop_codon:yes gene_type:complete
MDAVRTRNYWPLLALLGMAVLPLMLAMLSYFAEVAIPKGRVNTGELIVAPASVESWQLNDANGNHWQGQGRWQLLLVVEQCQDNCQAWRHTLGQLKKALGRDRKRVEQQLVLPLIASGDEAADLMMTDSDALVSAVASIENQGIWLADPLGNLVLRYRLDQPAEDLLKDLKRLLKVSNVG